MHRSLKKSALLLTLAYFLVSSHVYMMVGMEQDVSMHGHHAQHVAHHASSFCNWMCGASTFAHPANPSFSQNFNASFDNLAAYIEPFSYNLSVFYFRDRSPPVSLS
jgi:hypothetical protein